MTGVKKGQRLVNAIRRANCVGLLVRCLQEAQARCGADLQDGGLDAGRDRLRGHGGARKVVDRSAADDSYAADSLRKMDALYETNGRYMEGDCDRSGCRVC